MDQLECFELLCQYVTPVDVQGHQPGSGSVLRNHDWETILKLADRYLVTPSLYLGLQRRGLLKHLDEDLRHHLAAIYLLNSARNAKIKAQALAVIELLNSASINPVLFKGIANIFDGLYVDEGERVIGDIDLMVQSFELKQAVDILSKNGYKIGIEALELINNNKFPHKEVSLLHSQFLAPIDLHVRPLGASSGKLAFITEQEAIVDGEKVEWSGVYALMPSPSFRLLHNFYHAQHLGPFHFLYGLINVRQLLDWVKMCDKFKIKLDSEIIEKKLKTHRVLISYRLYVYTAKYYFGMSLSDREKRGLTERLLFKRQQWVVMKGWVSNVNFCLTFLFVSPVFLFTPIRIKANQGDIPLTKGYVLQAKKLFNIRWYQRRLKDIKLSIK